MVLAEPLRVSPLIKVKLNKDYVQRENSIAISCADLQMDSFVGWNLVGKQEMAR